MVKIGLKTEIPPTLQPTIGFSQINPGDGVQYEALAPQAYARIIAMSAYTVWSGAPSMVELWLVTRDVTVRFYKSAPASATSYYAGFDAERDDNTQLLYSSDYAHRRTFLVDGRQVQVLAEVSGGTVTLLGCVIRWAKW